MAVQNRNSARCRELVNEGALKGADPAEVVQSCDLVFSCVSDGPALKDLVFGNCGVLQGIGPGKVGIGPGKVDIGLGMVGIGPLKVGIGPCKVGIVPPMVIG